MRSAAVMALAAAVLAEGCTGDGAARQSGAAETPRCRTLPGRGPEGFVLQRARELEEGDRIATRLEYRDAQGRLLVYLLGLSGEIGEGLPLLARPTLPGGERARFLGSGQAWMLVWEDAFPCVQVAVVGNDFARTGFVRLLVSMGLLRPSDTSALLGRALTEWVAVFHSAADVVELDDDTDALMEMVPDRMIVGPVGCHQGLAEALGVPTGDTYFSGAVAGTREALNRAVARAVEHPLFRDGPTFTGELRVLCPAR